MSRKNFLLKSNALIMFISVAFQLFGCSSSQQNVSLENKPANKPLTIAEEKFIKQQKEKFEAVSLELEQNKRLWRETKIANYDFVCGQFAGGVRGWASALIKVRDGKAVSIEPAFKKEYPKLDGYEKFETVDKIFDYIRQELENGRGVAVEYDKKHSYPKEVFISYSFAIDAWHNVRITKLEIT